MFMWQIWQKEVERALLKAVVDRPNVTTFEHHFAVDLLTSENGIKS